MKNFKLSKGMIAYIISEISNSEDTGIDTMHDLFYNLGMDKAEDLEDLKEALEKLDNYLFPE